MNELRRRGSCARGNKASRKRPTQMTTMEKLFVGFWVWHTCEWLVSFVSHRKGNKQREECNQYELKSARDQADYWERVNLKSKIAFELYKRKHDKEIGEIPLDNWKN